MTEQQLEGLGDREQIHVELAVQVATLSPHEIDPLSSADRALVVKLRTEQDRFLQTLMERLRAFEQAKPGSPEQRKAARLVTAVVRSARRRLVYRLSPPVVRSVMRASWMTKSPVAVLYHFAPPMVRPVIQAALVARGWCVVWSGDWVGDGRSARS